MPILKTFKCDICEDEYTERSEGEGAEGFAQLNGIQLNGVINPLFCPLCVKTVAEFIDNLAIQKMRARS